MYKHQNRTDLRAEEHRYELRTRGRVASTFFPHDAFHPSMHSNQQTQRNNATQRNTTHQKSKSQQEAIWLEGKDKTHLP
jgi:hypothetical protein